MAEWLHLAAKYAIAIIDAMALIVIGTIEAFFAGLRAMLSASATRSAASGCATRAGSLLA